MLELLKKISCKIGLHWPMSKHVFKFVDDIAGDMIYYAVCPCGKTWRIETKGKYPIFKKEIK